MKLERTLIGLVNQAYGLTPAEIELLWKTAPHPHPAASNLISPFEPQRDSVSKPSNREARAALSWPQIGNQ